MTAPRRPPATITVLSYHAWLHPRTLKIAKSLAKAGYKVKIWGTRLFRNHSNLLFKVLEYIVSMFDVALLNSDLLWVENNPDIVYLPLAILGKKYVYDRRSPWALHVAMVYDIPQFLIKFMRIVEMFMARRAAWITAVSSGHAKEFVSLGVPITIIPNYPSRTFAQNISRDLRKELNIPLHKKIVIFVGKLSKVEGVDLLPDIVEKIKNLNAELWIVGDGPARNVIVELKRRYPKTLRWFGWVPYDRVPEFIAAADIGLVPQHKTLCRAFSSYEGIQKIAEYFALEKPVIASGIMPSPYYLVVEPEELGSVVAKAIKGEIKLPKPPRLYWEDFSEPRVLEIVRKLLKVE